MLGYLSSGLTICGQWISLEESYSIDVQSRIMKLHEKLQGLYKDALIISQYFMKAKIIVG